MPDAGTVRVTGRDPFGRLVVDPSQLSFEERVDTARRLAGELQAEGSREQRWLGRVLADWLAQGGDLVGMLGLRPQRSSKTTAQRVLALEGRDRQLVRLSAAAGGDVKALRVLTGEEPCSAALSGLVHELQRAGAPRSLAAFTRARARLSRHRR